MDLIAVGVLVLFILLFAGIVFGMVRAGKQRARRKVELARSLGFSPVDKNDPAFQVQIIPLHQKTRGQRLQLRNLCIQRGMGYDLYLFDLWDTAGEDSSQLVENGVAVVSGQLSLPRFSLIPKIQGSGLMTHAANWVLRKLIANAQVISFEPDSEFERAFTVVGYGAEEEIRAFLTPDLRSRLDDLGFVQLEAGGNLFTISDFVTGTVRKEGPEESARRLIADARDLERRFSG